MPLGPRKRGVKLLGQAQSPATSPLQSDASAVTSKPTEHIQKSSKREIWNSVTSAVFGSISGRSTHVSTPAPSPIPENFTQTQTDTTAPAPISSGPLKLGELLQQEASDLWTEAYNELSVEYKQDLENMGNTDNTDSDKPEKLEALTNLLEKAMVAKKENIANQWKLKFRGKEINVREKAEKLMSWITKFKEVVDIAVQYDPVHAALPWAGIRCILILAIGEQQNLQHAIIAMERIAFLVGRCTIYEKLYLIGCEEITIPEITKIATDELCRALVILYTAILRALSRCMRVFKGMMSTPTFWN